MANGNVSAITWKQIGVIIAMVGLFMAGGSVLYTKADKIELTKVEERCIVRLDKVEERVSEDINEIKYKLNKTYDLLLQIKTDNSFWNHREK